MKNKFKVGDFVVYQHGNGVKKLTSWEDVDLVVEDKSLFIDYYVVVNIVTGYVSIIKDNYPRASLTEEEVLELFSQELKKELIKNYAENL